MTRHAKNPAQAAGSLITYLRRYSLSAFANVAQEDDDGNSLNVSEKSKEPDAPKVINHKQIVTLRKMLEEGGSDSEEKFLKAYKINSLMEVSKSSFDNMCEKIKIRNASLLINQNT